MNASCEQFDLFWVKETDKKGILQWLLHTNLADVVASKIAKEEEEKKRVKRFWKDKGKK